MKVLQQEQLTSPRSHYEVLLLTKKIMLGSASYTITWPVRSANSIIFSVKSISMWTSNFPTQGSPFACVTDYRRDVAYMIADISEVNQDQIKDIYKKLSTTPFNIMTRVLY